MTDTVIINPSPSEPTIEASDAALIDEFKVASVVAEVIEDKIDEIEEQSFRDDLNDRLTTIELNLGLIITKLETMTVEKLVPAPVPMPDELIKDEVIDVIEIVEEQEPKKEPKDEVKPPRHRWI